MIVVADSGPLHYLILLEHVDLRRFYGERAAIALAEAMRADLLLIDEAAGRAEAKRRQLRVTGTLGVLRSGAERGLMNVPDLLERLKTTSFYLDEALVSMVFAPWLPRS